MPGRLSTNARLVARRLARARFHDETRPWRLGVIGLAGLAVLAIVAVAANVDGAAVGLASSLPSWSRELASFLSFLGRSLWFLVATGVVCLLFFVSDWRRVTGPVKQAWWELGALSGFVFVAFASGGIIVNLLKVVFGRARPPLVDEVGPYSFDPFSFGYLASSFPSGHSTDMGVFIVIGGLFFPAYRYLVLLLGILFASSRVFALAHYPSDVVAGLALGASVAYGVAIVYARAGYGLAFTPEGIRPKTDALRRTWQMPRGPWLVTSGLAIALVGGSGPAIPATAPPSVDRDRPRDRP